MASMSVTRRTRSMSYSQGDSSKYTLRSRTHSIDVMSREDVILEDDEVDVALLLSQLSKHHIDLGDQGLNQTSSVNVGDSSVCGCFNRLLGSSEYFL